MTTIHLADGYKTSVTLHGPTAAQQFAQALVEAGRQIDAERFVAVLDRGGSVIAGKDAYAEIMRFGVFKGVEVMLDSCIEPGVIYAVDMDAMGRGIIEGTFKY